MYKKIIKYLVLLFILFFLFMFYFGKNIYKYKLTEKKELTEVQIKKFEDDIKNGVEIDLDEYIVKDKDYSNNITKTNKKISNTISRFFRKIFEYFLRNINI